MVKYQRCFKHLLVTNGILYHSIRQNIRDVSNICPLQMVYYIIRYGKISEMFQTFVRYKWYIISFDMAKYQRCFKHLSVTNGILYHSIWQNIRDVSNICPLQMVYIIIRYGKISEIFQTFVRYKWYILSFDMAKYQRCFKHLSVTNGIYYHSIWQIIRDNFVRY